MSKHTEDHCNDRGTLKGAVRIVATLEWLQ